MAKLAPSILSADFKVLGKQLSEIEKSGVEILHIDVMDGAFVPNISMGFPVIKSIRQGSKMIFDVHLMVENPDNFIDAAAESGANIITVHQEACTHLNRTIKHIKEKGCRAGVALNPATSEETLRYVINDLDLLLIMTVNPGFGGQKFIPISFEKIHKCKTMIEESCSKAVIELDGGITAVNARECIEAGAEILVAGSAVFENDITENIKKFYEVTGGAK